MKTQLKTKNLHVCGMGHSVVIIHIHRMLLYCMQSNTDDDEMRHIYNHRDRI